MLELSAVVPALNEAPNLKLLLPDLHRVLSTLTCDYEIIVVDNQSPDGTGPVAASLGARVVQQTKPGYGGALEAGFRAAQGLYIVTLDADLSHAPSCIESLWRERTRCDVLVASRYCPGGASQAGLWRKLLSAGLNAVLRRVFSINVHDLSSGFRLYRADAVRKMELRRRDFAVLVEIIVRAYAAGWQVGEVPFCYSNRGQGRSHAQTFRFGLQFMATAYDMWKLRNSIACADYDARAHHSRIWFQRYWQHKRHQIITHLAPCRGRTLDIGCGSSLILTALGDEVIGLDIQITKLRYARRYGTGLAAGDIFRLPFPSLFFDCVVCSEVIEHIPGGRQPFDEMCRVLKPGGKLVLGTPDYGTVLWPLIERAYAIAAPGAYADEHITHYTRAGLVDLLGTYGMQVEAAEYVFGSEMILEAAKPGAAVAMSSG